MKREEEEGCKERKRVLEAWTVTGSRKARGWCKQ
jgi:hypothetical protein